MSSKKRRSKKKNKQGMKKPSKRTYRSLDKQWASMANLCLFSYTSEDGEEFFVSNEEERDWFGQGFEPTFKDYSVFAPDEIIHRVAGQIGNAQSNEEVLEAWIDGSYSFSDGRGCCAYSVFFQVGDRIAEYANTIYDGTGQYGATASELMAAIVAIKVGVAFGYSKIDLRHDYTGVAFFSDDARIEPNKRSKMYWIFAQYNAFLKCAQEVIDISYTKVKGHSLDIGNEHADFLARTYSKKGRKRIDAHIRSIKRKEKTTTPQIQAFFARYEFEPVTIAEIEQDMETACMDEAFGFDVSEHALIVKMLHDESTEDIMSQMLLTRPALAQKRREITVKLGMPEQSASDNTIVKVLLEWLYIEIIEEED